MKWDGAVADKTTSVDADGHAAGLTEKRMAASDNVIRIMCPNLTCKRILAVPTAARGKMVRCRGCGINLRIPTAKAADPAPAGATPEAGAKPAAGAKAPNASGSSASKAA
jgi:hypothetical protein